MSKDDRYRLRRIIEVGSQLANVIGADEITEEDILCDLHTQWLITTPLYNIGEQAYALSQEFKQAHPDVPWSAVAGLRHRLVHDYEGTNWSLSSQRRCLWRCPCLSRRLKAYSMSWKRWISNEYYGLLKRPGGYYDLFAQVCSGRGSTRSVSLLSTVTGRPSF